MSSNKIFFSLDKPPRKKHKQKNFYNPTKEELTEMIEERKMGVSAIAEALNMSKTKVAYLLKKHDLHIPKPTLSGSPMEQDTEMDSSQGIPIITMDPSQSYPISLPQLPPQQPPSAPLHHQMMQDVDANSSSSSTNGIEMNQFYEPRIDRSLKPVVLPSFTDLLKSFENKAISPRLIDFFRQTEEGNPKNEQ